MTEEIAARSSAAGLAFGVDIPFWYDAKSEYDGNRITATYRGENKPVSQHLIDLVDEIAVMAYRTSAFGADGIIRHAASELDYARQSGKKVYVAVETHPLPDEELIDFSGDPSFGIPLNVDGRGAVFMVPRGDSVAVLFADVDSDARLGLLEVLHETSGVEEDVVWWPVTRRVPVPGSKLSFASLGFDRLTETMEQALPELRSNPAFAGYAIHHVNSISRLLGEAKEAKTATEKPAMP